MINSDRKNINEIRDVALSFREEVNAETENHIMTEEQTVPEKHDDNNDKKNNNDKNDKGSKGSKDKRDNFITQLRNLGEKHIFGKRNITENLRSHTSTKKGDRNH